MTVETAIRRARALTGSAVEEAEMRAWLRALDGSIHAIRHGPAPCAKEIRGEFRRFAEAHGLVPGTDYPAAFLDGSAGEAQIMRWAEQNGFGPSFAFRSGENTLLLPPPWDEAYVHHLEAMTYYATGEYARYENARIMTEKLLGEYKAHVRRTHRPPGGGRVQIL